jgi:putative DNA primase/helicase
MNSLKAEHPEDMARYFNEFIGYAIQPHRPHACFFLLIGHGGNGKSMLLKTVQRLIGPDAVLNDSIAGFQRDRFNVAALPGKLLFVDDDLSENVVLDDGLLKKLSESKPMSARHAYGRRKFNFQSSVMVVMAGNTYPRTADVSKGMTRRAQVIPFDRCFEHDADPHLFPTIWEQEMPGVLNQALEGLKRLMVRGKFQQPGDCLRAGEEFFVHASPLVAFMDAMLSPDPEGRIQLKSLRGVMRQWLKEQGVKTVVDDKRLKRKLLALGYDVRKINGYETLFGWNFAVLVE